MDSELMRNMPNACPVSAVVLAGGKHIVLPWLVLQSCCWQVFAPWMVFIKQHWASVSAEVRKSPRQEGSTGPSC